MLDRVLDADNLMLHEIMRYTATLSNPQFILPAEDGHAAKPPPSLSGPEPAHTWCYYFEKADLARQQRNWDEVLTLAEKAFSLEDHPNNPSERIPFIEGYAHTGHWPGALEQTKAALDFSPAMQPVMCHLWRRIDKEVPPGPEKDAAVEEVLKDCSG